MFAAGANQYRADESLPGYVRVYHLVGDSWMQVGEDIVGEALEDEFGWLVSLSRSGSVLAVSAFAGRSFRGAAYVFEYSPAVGTWEPLGQVMQGKNTGDSFGLAMDFSGDGTTIAVGSWRKGATVDYPVYTRVFRLAEDRAVWNQLGSDIERVDPQIGGISISYGLSLALNDDGSALAMGSMHEELDDAGGNSGAVSVFRFTPAE